MGMFDRVYFKCRCGGEVEFQSKVGHCILASYTADEVPLAIADDIMGDTGTCVECGRSWKATTGAKPPKTIPMYLVDPNED